MNIDDEVLEAAKTRANFRKISVGEALSELARQGMEREVELTKDPLTGLMVLHCPGAPTLTSEEVYRLQAEEDLDKYLELMERLKAS